jgi:protein-disulfide isomerase
MEPSSSRTSPAVPIAIICGFGLIALAIFITNGRSDPAPATADQQNATNQTVLEDKIPRAVDETDADYILGNPNAPILLVEYSDYDCPFCKRYHNTLRQIMDEYGINGRVAWVYRQYPLTELHPNAPKIAETALCVGKLGGYSAFWEFTDLIYDSREATEFTNVTRMPDYIEAAGINLTEHEACLNSGWAKERLELEMRDGFDAGVRGTPYTFIIYAGEQVAISGAQPYETVKSIVANLIDQYEGEYDPTQATSTTELPRTDSGIPVLGQ